MKERQCFTRFVEGVTEACCREEKCLAEWLKVLPEIGIN